MLIEGKSKNLGNIQMYQSKKVLLTENQWALEAQIWINMHLKSCVSLYDTPLIISHFH